MGILQLIELISEYFMLFRIVLTILGIIGCYRILSKNKIYSIVKGPRFMLIARQIKSPSLGMVFMIIWIFQIILLIFNCFTFRNSFARVAALCTFTMFILERVIVYKFVVFYKLDKLWLLLLFTLLPIGLFAISYNMPIKQISVKKKEISSGADDSLNSSCL